MENKEFYVFFEQTKGTSLSVNLACIVHFADDNIVVERLKDFVQYEISDGRVEIIIYDTDVLLDKESCSLFVYKPSYNIYCIDKVKKKTKNLPFLANSFEIISKNAMPDLVAGYDYDLLELPDFYFVLPF